MYICIICSILIMYTFNLYPDAPCGAHTAATWFYSLRFVAADVVLEIAKCPAEFRGERSFLQVFRSYCQFSAGILH